MILQIRNVIIIHEAVLGGGGGKKSTLPSRQQSCKEVTVTADQDFACWRRWPVSVMVVVAQVIESR